MSLIKVAYLMLNFLNLKSFPLILFFVVASSLSTLCLVNLQTVVRKLSVDHVSAKTCNKSWIQQVTVLDSWMLTARILLNKIDKGPAYDFKLGSF